MEIVERIVDKKSKWKMVQITTPDGCVHLHTGLAPKGDQIPWENDRDFGNRIDFKVPRWPDARVELIDRVVVQAALKPDHMFFQYHVMVDRDNHDGLEIYMNSVAMHMAMKMILEGRMEIVNGYIEGRWTFWNSAGRISIYPDEKQRFDLNYGITPLKVDESAEDVSDFVMKM